MSDRLSRRCWPAFTLVELLVVIGIIALLISILLPALNAARRSANAVKCATQLRELGNAFRLYSIDNRNYYPPALLNEDAAGYGTGLRYNLYGIDYPIQAATAPVRIYGAYWFNFVNKYISKSTGGIGGTGVETQSFRNTVAWGCTSFDAYNAASGTAADFNVTQTGYGMNYTPYYTADGGSSSPNALNGTMTAANLATGTGFIKAGIWGRQSALRMLLVDNALYLAEAGAPPTDGTIVGLHSADQNVTRDANGTYVNVWRHGKFPTTGLKTTSMSNKGWYPLVSGKVAFNILYCDGHVNTETDPRLAYKTQRMKFPG